MRNKRLWFVVSIISILGLLAGGFGCAAPAPQPAAPIAKPAIPETTIITAYEPGSTGQAIAAGVAEAINRGGKSKARLVPSGTDVGRVAPLREGWGHVTILSNNSVFGAVMGATPFDDPSLGPQPIQMVWAGDSPSPFGVKADSNIKTPYDLKGKRVFYVPGSATYILAMAAHLAYANLTWDDVKVVKYAGYAAQIDGFKKGEIDIYFGSIISADAREIATLPGGVRWLYTPASEKDAWDRFHKVLPTIIPYVHTFGVNIDPAKPFEGATNLYMANVMKNASPEFTYFLAKTMDENYNAYKDLHPLLPTFNLKRQAEIALTKQWFPYHPGAVKYFKEKGIWTADMEDWNNKMIQREDALTAGWQKLVTEAGEKGGDPKVLRDKWPGVLKDITGWVAPPAPK